MARPRQFDEAKVLERALGTFWRLGYEGCSLHALLEATKLPRQSLYNLFGDKEGVFLAALAEYRRRVDQSLRPLDAPGAGVTALAQYIKGALQAQQAGGFGACLLVKTAFGPELLDRRVREAVEAGAGSVRAAFARVLARAAARSEVRRDVDPEAAAAYLFSVLHGLSALVQTGGALTHVDAVLAQALAGLQVAPPRKQEEKEHVPKGLSDGVVGHRAFGRRVRAARPGGADRNRESGRTK